MVPECYWKKMKFLQNILPIKLKHYISCLFLICIVRETNALYYLDFHALCPHYKRVSINGRLFAYIVYMTSHLAGCWIFVKKHILRNSFLAKFLVCSKQGYASSMISIMLTSMLCMYQSILNQRKYLICFSLCIISLFILRRNV